MSVGAQLRQARAERQLTMAEVSRATKIQPWVLEALEADRLHEQMSPIYVKGLLAAYAKFLHLEPGALVSQLPLPPLEPEPEPQPSPAPALPVALHVPWRLLGRLALVAAVGVAVVTVVRLQPLQRLSKALHTRSSSTSAKASVSKPKPSPPPAAIQPKLASVTPIPQSETTTTAPPALSLQPLKTLELAVTAHRSTWIRVRADGKLLTQQWLRRGASERWTAKKRFELVVAKPSQVELTLNGQSISPFAIAHRGRLEITHQGVTPLTPEE